MAISDETMNLIDGEAWKTAVMFHDYLENHHAGFIRTTDDVETLWGAIISHATKCAK